MSEPAWEMSCALCRRVVLTSSNRLDCVQALVVHRARQHPEAGSVISEGIDFDLVPAPVRCDLCGVLVEKPWWEYRTVAGAAEDDKWLVCDGCHAAVHQRRPLRALVQRTLRQQRQDLALDGITTEKHERLVTANVRAFIEQLDGPPERES